MLQDQHEIIKIWTNELTRASTEIVSATMRGEEIEKLPIAVTVMVPTPLVTAIARAAQATGADPDQIMSQMANHGFQKSIDEKLMMGRTLVQAPTVGTGPQAVTQDANDILGNLKAAGLDMSGLEGKMGQFGELMTMLSKMKEQFEDAAENLGGDVNKGQTPKDSQ